MACTRRSMYKSDNTVKLNMIFKCFFQMLHTKMKFTHVMIMQIIQEQSLDYYALLCTDVSLKKLGGPFFKK